MFVEPRRTFYEWQAYVDTEAGDVEEGSMDTAEFSRGYNYQRNNLNPRRQDNGECCCTNANFQISYLFIVSLLQQSNHRYF